ncbi:hypothetical protein [Mucilaginibacter sp. dw_454]|uniref:hypothetical protein n=1 Tax=Mucilaginibacter sp. dw_454 TaxID=2720079 RepID=UPI001BD62655|nr:hypothetical protein [Mucilaginibacter sp. dw_454]
MPEKRSETVASDIDELTIYQGGSLSEIRVEDLKDNEVAIKQLLNTYHLKLKEGNQKDANISILLSQVEFLKTTPFIGIVTSTLNIIGSIIIAISVNLEAAKPPVSYSNLLLFLGFALVVIGSIINILYPYIKGWFNGNKVKK